MYCFDFLAMIRFRSSTSANCLICKREGHRRDRRNSDMIGCQLTRIINESLRATSSVLPEPVSEQQALQTHGNIRT